MKLSSSSALEVFLHWDSKDIQPVGRLAYRDNVAYLEYDDTFIKSGLELSPVHHKTSTPLIMPHNAAVFEGLHGVFHDSLPDGWGRLLIDRRARQLGVEPAGLTPLDRLACVGSNGIGALCYAPAINPWGTDDGKALNLDALATDARLVLEGDVGDVISTLGRAGGSPGGARPKALIAVNQDDHAVHGVENTQSGYEHYLLKFPGHGDPDDIAEIEMAYALMAKEAGVVMPETRLLEGGNGQPYFAAKRFDRIGDLNGGSRVHVHSASGLLYTDIRIPQLDYQDLILLTRSLTRDHRECKAMFTLGVFNVLSHNRDDHARQFSYIMERDGNWKLAPAYDLTWSMGPGGEHSTSVLGYGKDISRAELLRLGRKADLNTQDANEIIEHVTEAVGGWQKYAKETGVGKLSKNLISASLKSVALQ